MLFRSSAVARYYFHPLIAIQPQDGHGRLNWNGATADYSVDTGSARLKKAYYAPAFGARVDNSCLELRETGGRMALALYWS